MIDAPQQSLDKLKCCRIHRQGELKSPCLQEISKQLQIVKIVMILDCARFCAHSNKKSTYE